MASSSSSSQAFLCFCSWLFLFMVVANGGSIIGIEDLPVISFEEGYTQLFGDSNLMVVRDGKKVHLSLDRRTGAGFASQDLYLYGLFSASIKLPSDYAAGVVVAFYMSNGDLFEKNHDELDFEFLGNVRGREWRLQTNVYGNGSTSAGREERYDLWFDPTEDFHRYTILWSCERIIFYVDDVPIRELVRNPAMGGHYPSKPMSLYATIWDGSNWATSGGRYKVNYKFAPYIAEFTDLSLHGCVVDPTDHSSTCHGKDSYRYDTVRLNSNQRSKMERFRRSYMTYSYCYDHERYQKPLPECKVDDREAKHIRGAHRRHWRSHHATAGLLRQI